MDSLELRISKIESKLPEILQRINIYDLTIAEVKSMHESNKSLVKNLEELKVSSANLSYENSKLKEDVKKLQGTCDNLSLAHSNNSKKQIQDREIDRSSNEKLLSEINQKHSTLSQEVNSNGMSIKKTLEMVSSQKDLLFVLDKKFKEVTDSISNFKSLIERHSDDLSKCFQMISNLKSQIDIPNPDIPNLKARLDDFASTLAQHRERMNEALAGQKNAFNSQLNEVKASIVPVDLSPIKEEIKSSLVKTIESHSLDVRNANLKIGNNEMNVKLLEKKFENLNLLLKKYELTQ